MGNHNQPLMNNINPIRVLELQDNATIPKRNPISTSDKLHGYCLIQAKTKLYNIALYKVECGGLTCDSLNAYAADKCPCYQVTDREAPICLILELDIIPSSNYKTFKVINFTSKSFTKFFMKNQRLPLQRSVSELTKNCHAYTKLMHAVEHIIP